MAENGPMPSVSYQFLLSPLSYKVPSVFCRRGVQLLFKTLIQVVGLR